ncbi:GNAT family N-acetyltransferase [Pseudonocardia sp. TRM90224]|uniref:GNAT family N-acetyltransferase n=1 Tax=Pseudonocardia sp. TRM90224 TaxID=2812678 RepID=UPI001E5B83F2|nr:GNAT family N-acetyltransferase [Pseudonocardia sp. TRM90224]
MIGDLTHHRVTMNDVAQPAVLRDATPDDVDTIARFIRELAAAEDFPGAVTSTASDVHEVLFGPEAFARAVVVELDGVPVGFALHHATFSTITGRRGVHLEDLYIVEQHRGRGLGELVMRELAARARRHGGRLDWWVLRTNEAGLRFYRRLGAREAEEITVCHLG